MRWRLLWAMVLVTLLAMVGEGVPRIIYLRRALREEAHARLERDLGRVALVVQRSTRNGQRQLPEQDIFRSIGANDRLVIREPNGKVTRIGAAPEGDEISSKTVTLDGVEVTIYRPPSGIDSNVRTSVGLLVATTASGIAIAALAALYLSRSLTRPMEDLARAARRLEAGDVPAPLPSSGITEIDAVAEGIESSGARIAGLLQAEREFATNANHQMRSAMTGLSLLLQGLEANEDADVRSVATEGIRQVNRVESIVEELLLLARTGRAGEQRTIDLRQLVLDHVRDAKALASKGHRSIVVRPLTHVEVSVVPGALGQILDILLANALRHGSGKITVGVYEREGWAQITVGDQGRGVPANRTARMFERSDTRHGIGLWLAQSLAESEGGVVELVEHPETMFRIRLPIVSTPTPR